MPTHLGMSRFQRVLDRPGTKWNSQPVISLQPPKQLRPAAIASQWQTGRFIDVRGRGWAIYETATAEHPQPRLECTTVDLMADRKSTRLNSSHQIISYAVFCL